MTVTDEKPAHPARNTIAADILAAEAYYRAGRLQAAAATYDLVLAYDADHVEALEWRGEIAVQLDDYAVAEACLSRARALRGDAQFGEFTNLGLALYELGQAEAAVEALLCAIRRDEGDLVSHSNLGKALYDYHHQAHVRRDEAARDRASALAADWLRQFPGNPDARHIGAAISGADTPQRAGPAYVADVFNDYAPGFDTKLAELGYCAPELINALLQAHLPRPTASETPGLRILDAGCGTGLLGRHLRPHAGYLCGVDLSPGMLARALEKQIYDALQEGDLLSFLNGDMAEVASFDVIAAADVLCYFGALEDVFRGFARNLAAPGGLLAFSLERLTRSRGPHPGYVLDPSGRYKHATSYVRAALARAGLSVDVIDRAILRHEYGRPVHGLVILARPAAAG